jgi:hypothetical protein
LPNTPRVELIVILVGGLLGWQQGTFGKRELQIIGIVVAGWTAGTTAASVPYLTLAGFLTTLVYHTVVVTVPYGVGVLAKRVAGRRR